MNDTTPRIGVIGIGAMGFAMAANLQRRGYRVQVRDIDPAAVAAAAAIGLASCESSAAVAAISSLACAVRKLVRENVKR